jgi:hypothetical protein
MGLSGGFTGEREKAESELQELPVLPL